MGGLALRLDDRGGVHLGGECAARRDGPLPRCLRADRPLHRRRLPARLVRRSRSEARGLVRRNGATAAAQFGRHRRGLAGDERTGRTGGLGQRLLPRPLSRRGARRRGDDLRRARPLLAARSDSRRGSGQHVAGVQPMGRKEPVRRQQRGGSGRPRFVRAAVRAGLPSAPRVGDAPSPIPGARGLRRRLPDRRRHAPRSGESPALSARDRRRSRRVLVEPNARRLRAGAGCRDEHCVLRCERRLLADSLREPGTHDRRLQVSGRPGARPDAANLAVPGARPARVPAPRGHVPKWPDQRQRSVARLRRACACGRSVVRGDRTRAGDGRSGRRRPRMGHVAGGTAGRLREADAESALRVFGPARRGGQRPLRRGLGSAGVQRRVDAIRLGAGAFTPPTQGEPDDAASRPAAVRPQHAGRLLRPAPPPSVTATTAGTVTLSRPRRAGGGPPCHRDRGPPG